MNLGLSPDVAGAVAYGLLAFGLGAWLLAISLIDLASRRIPDRLVYPLIATGLVVSAAASRGLPTPELIGAAVGYALFWAVGEAHFRWRGEEGLGLGDAKLFAAAGAWLGWAALPFVLLGACLFALAHALARHMTRRGSRPARQIPFGPSLALAFWLAWIAPPWLAP